MRQGFWGAAAIALATLAAGVPTAAHADISYTQEAQMPGGAGKSVTLTQARKGSERVETTMSFGAGETKSVTLTVCADRKVYTLDPSLKLYYARPIKLASSAGNAASAAASGTGAAGGKIIFTVGVKDLGKEQIGQYATRHYQITQRLQTSGCAGTMDNTTRMEVWVAPSVATGGNGCPELAGMGGLQALGKPGCTCAILQKGDVAAYQKAMQGLRVRTQMYSSAAPDAQPIMTMDVKNVSTTKLADNLFSVPKDYRLVTEDEFNAAKQKAMTEAFSQQATANSNE